MRACNSVICVGKQGAVRANVVPFVNGPKLMVGSLQEFERNLYHYSDKHNVPQLE